MAHLPTRLDVAIISKAKAKMRAPGTQLSPLSPPSTYPIHHVWICTLLALVHLPARSFQHTQDHGTALRKLPTRLPLPSPWSPSSPSRLPRLPPVGSALCLSACVTPPTAPSQTLGSFVTSACFLRCLSLAGWRSSRRDKDFKASRMEPYTMPAFNKQLTLRRGLNGWTKKSFRSVKRNAQHLGASEIPGASFLLLCLLHLFFLLFTPGSRVHLFFSDLGGLSICLHLSVLGDPLSCHVL